MSKVKAEYIWIDGAEPTQHLRSKTKIVDGPVDSVDQLPQWTFDGSSTYQAPGHDSECYLHPVATFPDPLRRDDHLLVLCEVFQADGMPHETNRRQILRRLVDEHGHLEPWFGIEQELTLFDGIKPLGWPDNGFPAPQGGYYCGVGADEVFGRDLIERHLDMCLAAGLHVSGINAEVMPGQWEFQIGPVGAPGIADEIWIARWLLYRLGEDTGISATLHPKPVKGDWNGAGAHTNFSIKTMREPGGIESIYRACERLRARHDDHIRVYGADNDQRLTGRHETCHISEFRYGVGDRGASIRIPALTAVQGYGYLEDRRPAANADPYLVCAALIETVCSEG